MNKSEAITLLNLVGQKVFGRGYLPYTNEAFYKVVTLKEFIDNELPHDCDEETEEEFNDWLHNSLSSLVGVQCLAHGVSEDGKYLPLNSIDEVKPGAVIGGFTDDPDQTVWRIIE